MLLSPEQWQILALSLRVAFCCVLLSLVPAVLLGAGADQAFAVVCGNAPNGG